MRAVITIQDDRGIIKKCFEPEDKKIKGKAQYTVTGRDGKVVFTIKAVDSTALRTVCNSVTKMLTVIEKMKDVKWQTKKKSSNCK